MSSGLCQVVMYGGQPCGRMIVSNDLCICHLDDPNKDKYTLSQEIDSILNNVSSDVYDFSRFILNEEIVFIVRRLRKPVIFKECKFYSDQAFDKIEFMKDVIIDGCTILGQFSFSESSFKGKFCLLQSRISTHESWFGIEGCRFEDIFYVKDSNIEREFTCNDTIFSKGFGIQNTHFGGVFQIRTTLDTGSDFMQCEFSEPVFIDIVFNEDSFFYMCEFQSIVTFNCSAIETELHFNGCKFLGEDPDVGTALQFRSTKLAKSAKLSMTDCYVSNGMSFSRATLEGTVIFTDSRFAGFVDFEDATLGSLHCDASRTHDHNMFQGGLRLVFVPRAECTVLRFRHVDLCSVQFLGTLLNGMEFAACRWGKPNDDLGDEKYLTETIKDFRRASSDNQLRIGVNAERVGITNESDIPHAYVEVAQVYRGLQQKYLEYIDPYQAGVFHRKEMLMIRHSLKFQMANIFTRGKIRMGFKGLGMYLLYMLYGGVSRYGESIGLPLAYVSIIVFLTPVVFMFLGVRIDGTPIHYTLASSLQNIVEFLGNYFSLLRETISVLLFRSNSMKFDGWQGTILFWESLLTPILMTFLILTIRRRFKRKSY